MGSTCSSETNASAPYRTGVDRFDATATSDEDTAPATEPVSAQLPMKGERTGPLLCGKASLSGHESKTTAGPRTNAESEAVHCASHAVIVEGASAPVYTVVQGSSPPGEEQDGEKRSPGGGGSNPTTRFVAHTPSMVDGCVGPAPDAAPSGPNPDDEGVLRPFSPNTATDSAVSTHAEADVDTLGPSATAAPREANAAVAVEQKCRSLELELSSFRREVAAAVVQTSSLLSDVQLQVRHLRDENRQLLEWKRAMEQRHQATEAQVVQLKSAVADVASAEASSRTKLNGLVSTVDALQETLRQQREHVQGAVVSSKAATADVQDMRAHTVDLEARCGRNEREMANLLVTTRAEGRMRDAATTEVKGLRAEVASLQRRVERHRDHAMFGATTTTNSTSL